VYRWISIRDPNRPGSFVGPFFLPPFPDHIFEKMDQQFPSAPLQTMGLCPVRSFHFQVLPMGDGCDCKTIEKSSPHHKPPAPRSSISPYTYCLFLFFSGLSLTLTCDRTLIGLSLGVSDSSITQGYFFLARPQGPSVDFLFLLDEDGRPFPPGKTPYSLIFLHLMIPCAYFSEGFPDHGFFFSSSFPAEEALRPGLFTSFERVYFFSTSSS